MLPSPEESMMAPEPRVNGRGVWSSRTTSSGEDAGLPEAVLKSFQRPSTLV